MDSDPVQSPVGSGITKSLPTLFLNGTHCLPITSITLLNAFFMVQDIAGLGALLLHLVLESVE